ncbi:hypothetical protein Nepgr_020492 [Nepenthes gracilis]|uniref:Uncharacterized protein n=1 Tax=Nepenthes gracilis TaxID=150966 RepID=A0AAD3SYZ1_NEPGR|nr:hypothetical protein Nepgr_020492 [Nepenthes gracilis]
MEDTSSDTECSSDESEFGSHTPVTSGAGTLGGLVPKPRLRVPLRVEERLRASRGSSHAGGRLLLTWSELRTRLRSELRTRLRPEGVNPVLEQTYFDAIRLYRRLASLENPSFRVGVLDPRNSLARTRDQLVDYRVQSSSTGHWDH